jgi:transcription elongation factor GreA
MVAGSAARQSDAMADDRMTHTVLPSSPADGPPPSPSGVVLTAGDYAELMRELDELRGRLRLELAQRLRDARDFGSSGDGDDRLAALEDAAFVQARIAQLERLAESASVVEAGAGSGDVAGLGSSVRVADATGRAFEYELVGRRGADSTARQVSLASPIGKALAGARAGDVAHVALPNGGVRELHVLDVNVDWLAPGAAPHAAAIKAA